RNEVEVRLRNLDVEAGDAVVANLQGLDAGARALLGFEGGDRRAATLRQIGQLVEVRAVPRADESRLTAGGEFLGERSFQQCAEIAHPGERRRQLAQQRRGARRQSTR